MPITIPAAYIETFESNVRQLAQQKISRLRNSVTEVNRQSEKHNWDRLAAIQCASEELCSHGQPGWR